MQKLRQLVLILLSITLISTPFISKAETYSQIADELLIPEYSGEPYVEIDNNKPSFKKSELKTKSYEYYSELDEIGRCGYAKACIGKDIMPTEKRGAIGMIKPSGWHTVKYMDIIDGNYLYNRCHLIGYQLAGENANEKNLITGTRYLNVVGMLPFENEVTDYVKETNHHVMYRVTPIFEGDNLVASGVQMEAQSVEDDKISFNVYVYNVQPGVSINYANGESTRMEEPLNENKSITEYVLNKNTLKFHERDCSSVSTIKPQNKENYSGDRNALIEKGYSPCKRCNP